MVWHGQVMPKFKYGQLLSKEAGSMHLSEAATHNRLRMVSLATTLRCMELGSARSMLRLVRT